MNPELFPAIFIAVCAVFGVIVLGALLADAYAEMAKLKALRYHVDAVNAADAPQYQKLNPLNPAFTDFVRAVTDNPGLAAHHDEVRKSLLRHQTMHPGAALFVKVLNLP